MFFCWTIAALFGGYTVAYLVTSITVLLLVVKKMHFELFLGFFFILLLSDNLDERLWFAKSFKNVYMLAMAYVLLVYREQFKPYSKLITFFIPFFFVAVFALQFAGDLATGIQKTLSYILFLLVVPNFLLLFMKLYGQQFLKDIVHFLLLIVIIGYIVSYVSPSFAYIEGMRLRGFFGNPNGLGIFLFLFFSFYMVVNSFYPNLFSVKERRLLILSILVALILCGSRTAFISIIILVVMNWLYAINIFLSILVLFIIVLSYDYILNTFIAFIQSIGMSDYFRINTLEEGSGRFIAWAFAWQKIQPFFFFGGGFGNDEFIMRRNYYILTRLGHQGGVHNSYLTLWFDAGLIGLIAYFRGLFLLFLKGAKKTKLAIPLLFSVLFSITYESWVAGSLNPFTIVLFFSITLIFEESFQPVRETNVSLFNESQKILE